MNGNDMLVKDVAYHAASTTDLFQAAVREYPKGLIEIDDAA